MRYWKVLWHHEFDQEPTVLYSEIDETGYEVRKVQGYRSGTFLKSDQEHETGDISLSEIPVGNIDEVNAMPEFTASLISRAEFEELWNQARWPHLR